MTAPAPPPLPKVDTGLQKLGLTGLALTLLLVGILGVWAASTMISGAIIAPGQAVVRGDVKVVQNLDGGIVQSIDVQDGDVVQAGDLLIRLDPTVLEANLGIARNRLSQALTLKARLQAEQHDAESLVFAYAALPFALPDTAEQERTQKAIFEARRAVRQGQEEQLQQALQQLQTQSQGLAGQITSVREQLALLEHELENRQSLAEQQLIRQSELSQLQQTLAERTGQLVTLEAEQARLQGARQTAELDLLQAKRNFVEQTVTELQDVNGQIEELILEILTLEEQLARVDVLAPATGIVHQMQITTTGGILPPGGTILEIVPIDEGIEFEIRLDPRTIDRVFVGQSARMIIASLEARLRPELEASVRSISPGTITDPATGQVYYRATLEISAAELQQLNDTMVLPGMPVEAFLEVSERSVLAYLVQPISQQLRHTFRE